MTKHAPGCSAYTSTAGKMLIAHAGGGMPDRMYPNSIAALDRSYADGFRTFEMDFHQLPWGSLRAGHDTSDLFDPRSAWMSDVLAWLRRHPDAHLIVDMKTDNLAGLTRIAADAGDLKSRIIPFVYHVSQYDAVRALGFARPVYALFNGADVDWLKNDKDHDFAAVALSSERFDRIPDVRHPVAIFTFDKLEGTEGANAIITNCLIPAKGEQGPGTF
jgi:hypothetical protein